FCVCMGAGLPAMAQSQWQSFAPSVPSVPSTPSVPSLNRLKSFTPARSDADFGPLDPSQPVGITSQQIILRFAAKESQFKRALSDYTYRRTVKLDSIDSAGNIDGEYLQVDDIVFSPTGLKQEKVVYEPDNTLTRAALSPADFDDIEHRLPFTLTTEDVGKYHLTYVGKQRIDRVATYVFDVTPRHVEKGRRYFQGRIWVDASDFQIIVTRGKNIPDDTRVGQEDLSIPFTTYRQQIDGKYWFPVYTRAEGTLHFDDCKKCLPNDLHLRETVRYDAYKRFGSNVRIVYEGLDHSGDVSQSSPVSIRLGGSQPAGAPAADSVLAETNSIRRATTKE
ncbi:MAG: hypothetical protein ABI076_11860, partial [Acidobacteriaceae bacterium]